MAKPNVVVFFTDDQRFGTIRALGNTQIQTPNMDRLASLGTAFTQAHIMGGTSGAVCMPSRAMLHTGRTLFHIEGEGQSISDDHVMLGEVLRQAGYSTYGLGKWHNGKNSFNRAFGDGDEIYFGGMCDHWNVPAYHYDPSGAYEKQLPLCVDPFTTNKVRWRNADHVEAGKHSSELLCDGAVRFLEEYRDEAPFFLYVAFMAPHDPRTMPKKYLDMYDPERIELPPNFMGGHPFDNGELKIRDEMLEGWPRTPEAIRRHLAEYFAMITHADAEMGRVVQSLEDSGHLENTIIVFAGDNGLALGQHGLMGKQSLYDHSVRVPLIMAGPGIPAGARRETFCYLIDIYPTLCDLIGVQIPSTVEGRSLIPALGDSGAEIRDHLLLAYRHLMRGVREGNLKLIETVVEGRRTTQIFDLAEDPYELQNLAQVSKHAGDLERLRRRLESWRTEWGDTREQGQTFWSGYDRAGA
ncbi:sulfatase-like hydrolase/transferase [bacterium]|nr:sulfatase-like hydrolase/transferase [bacterium]